MKGECEKVNQSRLFLSAEAYFGNIQESSSFMCVSSESQDDHSEILLINTLRRPLTGPPGEKNTQESGFVGCYRFRFI